MEAWSISRRINAMTLALLACIVLVGLMGVGSLLRLAAIFDDYRSATENVRIATDLFGSLAEAEIAEQRYRASPSEPLIDNVRRNLDEIAVERDTLIAGLGPNSDLATVARRIFADGARFREAFERMQLRQGERDAAVIAMTPQWDDLEGGLGALETLLMFEGNQRVTANLDAAKNSALTGRIYVERFLLSNDPEDMRAAGEHFRAARQRIEDSRTIVSNAARKEGFSTLTATLDGYWGAFSDAVDAILARNIQRETLDGIARAMAQDIEQLLDTVAARQAELGAKGERLRIMTLISQAMAAIAALAAGYGLAQFMAGRIALAISQSVSQMRALADGNLDLAITGTAHDHELGEMARALEVFRDNGRAAEALRAEQEAQKREAAKRTEESAAREKSKAPRAKSRSRRNGRGRWTRPARR